MIISRAVNYLKLNNNSNLGDSVNRFLNYVPCLLKCKGEWADGRSASSCICIPLTANDEIFRLPHEVGCSFDFKILRINKSANIMEHRISELNDINSYIYLALVELINKTINTSEIFYIIIFR